MPRGGKRPGAGRKPKTYIPKKDWRDENLALLRSVFTSDDVRAIAEKLRDLLKAGDKDAMKHLAYVFGAPPKEVTLKGDEDTPLKLVVEIEHIDRASKS